jgi:hypothetical protein
MLNLAQVGSVICVVSLVLAFNGRVADAGLSSVCVAAGGSATSLLLQVKDYKWKKKKYRDGYDYGSRSDGGGGGVTSSGTNSKAVGGVLAEPAGTPPEKGSSTPATDNSQPGKGTQAGGTDATVPANDAFTKNIEQGSNIQPNQLEIQIDR